MKQYSKCNLCGVEILDDTKVCPLCHNVLEAGNYALSRYPNVREKQKKLSLTLRILLVVWISVTAISVFLNVQIYRGWWWSVLVGGILFYPLYLIYMIAKDKGYIHRMFSATIGALILVLLIDGVTGFHGWSVDYLLPGALILVDIALLVLMIVNRRRRHSYMIFQLAVVCLGIVPLILIAVGLVQHPLFSEIAFLLTVLVFLGTLIIGGQEARQELKRRFHV